MANNGSTEKRYLVKQRARDTVLVDLDGNIIDPEEAKRLAESIIESVDRPDYVYIGIRHSDGWYKVGRSENVERRKGETGIDEIMHTIECSKFGDYSAQNVERCIHRLLTVIAIEHQGEWYKLGTAIGNELPAIGTPESIVDGNRDAIYVAKVLFDSVLESSLEPRLYSAAHNYPLLKYAARWVAVAFMRFYCKALSNQGMSAPAKLIEGFFWHAAGVEYEPIVELNPPRPSPVPKKSPQPRFDRRPLRPQSTYTFSDDEPEPDEF